MKNTPLANDDTDTLLRKLTNTLRGGVTTFGKVTTSGGATYVTLGAGESEKVILYPHATVPCQIQLNAAGEFIPLLAANGPVTITGINNKNQIGVKRTDGGAAVDVQFQSSDY